MSASRDASQKIAFVYTNFYSLYKKGKEAAVSSSPVTAIQTPESGRIIRSGHMRPGLRIKTYTPTQFEETQNLHPRHQEVNQLKDSLKSLKDLQSRLNFMLTELADLSSKKSDQE